MSTSTIEQIRSAHSAEPFKPFVLRLADGREVRVEQREFMALSPSGRAIAVYQPDDSHSYVDVPMVTALEFKPLKNGGRKRYKQ